MKTKRGRIVWCVFLVAVVVVGLAFYGTRHQPVARIPLPDGTELRLEYVTYGTEHRVPGANRFIAWASKQAQRWPQLGIVWREEEYGYSTGSEQLILWFTHFDPRKREFLTSLDRALKVELVEEAGFRAEIGRAQSLNGWMQGKFRSEDSLPMPHTAFNVEVYNRRAPALPLRLTMQGKVFDLAVANPVAKLSFPEWQPGPLPQTRRVGELEVVLSSQTVKRDGGGPPQVRTDFTLLHEGKPTRGIRMTSLRLLDATGNDSSRGAAPPLSEPAWKVRATVVRTPSYPFAETDGKVSDPVPMPGAGQFAVLPSLAEDPRKGLRFSCLLGPGHYVWDTGAFVETGEVLDGPAATAFLAVRKPNSIRINTATPLLVSFLDFDTQVVAGLLGNPLGNAPVSRIRWDGRSHGFRQINVPERVVRSMPETRLVAEVYDLSVKDDENQDFTAPSPGTLVAIQVIPIKPETIEFFVAPPKLSGTTMVGGK